LHGLFKKHICVTAHVLRVYAKSILSTQTIWWDLAVWYAVDQLVSPYQKFRSLCHRMTPVLENAASSVLELPKNMYITETQLCCFHSCEIRDKMVLEMKAVNINW